MITNSRPADAAARKREREGSAVVVGASLAGLMTSLVLARAGIHVTMLERATSFPWTSLHEHLRGAVDDHPHITLHHTTRVRSVGHAAPAAAGRPHLDLRSAGDVTGDMAVEREQRLKYLSEPVG